MIKFFRHIRRSLINENNMGKYFKYAIGEILLVVIGILIALQINNWNEHRKDKQKSINYHKRLLEDVNLIITSSEKLYDRSTLTLQAISETIKILEKGTISNDKEQSIFDDAIIKFPRFSYPVPELSTFDEMKSNGDLNLITSKELLKTINSFNSGLNLTKKVFEKHALNVQSNMINYSKYIKFSVDPNTLEASASSNFQKMALDKEYINAFSLLEIDWRTNSVFSRNLIKDGEYLQEQLEIELGILTND